MASTCLSVSSRIKSSYWWVRFCCHSSREDIFYTSLVVVLSSNYVDEMIDTNPCGYRCDCTNQDLEVLSILLSNRRHRSHNMTSFDEDCKKIDNDDRSSQNVKERRRRFGSFWIHSSWFTLSWLNWIHD